MHADPTVLEDLAALDRALAGEPSPFTELVSDVRATRPVMSSEFAARLDARVDEARVAPPRRSWLAWSPLAGLALAAVVAAVVVSSRDTTTSPPVPTANDSASTAAAPKAAAGAGVSPQLAAPPSGRRVERNTSLQLSAARTDVQSVADDVIATTQRFGGIVDSSQISTSDADASAVFALRIPTARLDDAVTALSKLAHVASLSQGATDITGAFVEVAGRLHDARAERQALLRALGRAATTQEVDAIHARLRDNRSQIAAIEGELNALRRRADLARVDVTVAGNATGATGGGDWTPADAARDALRVLEVAAGVALVGLAAALPLALLAAAAALAARSARRRRREGALGPV